MLIIKLVITLAVGKQKWVREGYKYDNVDERKKETSEIMQFIVDKDLKNSK